MILNNYLFSRTKFSINSSLKGKKFYEFCSIISKNFTGVLMKSLECQQNNCKGKNITFQKFNFVTFDVNNYVNLNLKININNLFKYYNSTYM